jgi:hypothetical protein
LVERVEGHGDEADGAGVRNRDVDIALVVRTR